MTDGWQDAVIEGITAETPTVKTFRLRPQRAVTFLAGQHIDVRLTAPDGYTAVRSYSITSSPTDTSVVEIAVERLRDGEVSPFFHDVAEAGDTIEIRGPFTRHFVWRPESDGAALLVGGGSGIAPLMAMVRHRATVADSEFAGAAPATLLYSARTWNDVIFRDELLSHEAAQHGFQLRFAITRGSLSDGVSARGVDYDRRVDEGMLRDVIAAMPTPPVLVFVCGNNGFVNGVADAMIAAGVDTAAIRTERYGE